MAVNIAVVKTPAGTLAPATAYDAEILRDYAAGRQLKVEIKQMGNRSYQHHKLFFGGLLPLAYEYWVPSGGLVTDGEQKLISGFARRLEAMHLEADFVQAAFAEGVMRTMVRLAEKGLLLEW